MNKILSILLGVVLFSFGIGVIIHPQVYDAKHDYHLDFSEIKWPFGIFLSIIGLFSIIYPLAKGAKYDADKYSMCPACMKPFSNENISNSRCPECGNDVEDLEGFYDRHPELKK